MKRFTKRTAVLLLAPIIHLFICLVVALRNPVEGWELLIKIDFPISAFIVSALYSFDHPFLLFALFGTVWWFMFGYLVYKVAHHLKQMF